MKYLKLFEEYVAFDISRSIIEQIKEWGKSPIEINSGDCHLFAENMLIKYPNENIIQLTGTMFYELFEDNDLEDAIDIFGEENLIINDNGVWIKDMLEKYGTPPIDLHSFKTLLNHSWLYYNGKHYDAENIEGVDEWHKLSCWERFGIKLY